MVWTKVLCTHCSALQHTVPHCNTQSHTATPKQVCSHVFRSPAWGGRNVETPWLFPQKCEETITLCAYLALLTDSWNLQEKWSCKLFWACGNSFGAKNSVVKVSSYSIPRFEFAKKTTKSLQACNECSERLHFRRRICCAQNNRGLGGGFG